MGKTQLARRYRLVKQFAVCLILNIVLTGCGLQGPPLSQKAKEMVTAVQQAMACLTTALPAAMAHQDHAAVEVILRENYAAIHQRGTLPVRRIGVTDEMGSILMEYPVKVPIRGIDFSKYKPVANALHKKIISQERLYLKDRPEIFLVCGPLLKQAQVVGTVWIAFDADKIRESWEVTTEEFLKINFNQKQQD